MKITYLPEGVPEERAKIWSFNARKLLNVEAEEIERRTGLAYDEWIELLPPDVLSMRAIHGLLYVLLKRDEPTLKWEAVQFCLDDLTFELEAYEKTNALEAVRALLNAGRIPADKVDEAKEALDELERELAAAEEAEADDEAPKEPLPELISTTNGGQHSATPGDGIPETSTA